MNVKQKMIEAMRETYATHGQKGALRTQMPSAETTAAMLDAALAVMAERAGNSFAFSDYFCNEDISRSRMFCAVINHIREQEA